MKREAWDHPKFKLLARDLKLPMCYVRGIMTSVWLAATINFPAGDIGRWTNEEIAVSIDYPGDADELIAALVKRKLLDVIDEEAGRLYIHDWHEHCDRYVNLRILKTRSLFANGSPPRRKEHETPVEEGPIEPKSPKSQQSTRKNAKERETPSTNGSTSLSVVSPITSPSPSPSPGVEEGEPPLLPLVGCWAPLGNRLNDPRVRDGLRAIEANRATDQKLNPVRPTAVESVAAVLETNQIDNQGFAKVLAEMARIGHKAVNPEALVRIWREQRNPPKVADPYTAPKRNETDQERRDRLQIA